MSLSAEDKNLMDIALGNGAIELKRQVDVYLDEVDAALIEGFRNHPKTDSTGLQHIGMQLAALEALRLKITTVIDTGIMANKAQEH